MWALWCNTALSGQATSLSQQAHTMSSDWPEASGVRLCLSRPSLQNSQCVRPIHRLVPLQTTCFPVKTHKQYVTALTSPTGISPEAQDRYVHKHQGKHTFVESHLSTGLLFIYVFAGACLCVRSPGRKLDSQWRRQEVISGKWLVRSTLARHLPSPAWDSISMEMSCCFVCKTLDCDSEILASYCLMQQVPLFNSVINP